MTSVYLASRYSRRDELREHAKRIQALGIQVTARWLLESAPLDVQLKDVPQLESEEIAIQDIQDIDLADGFVFFAEDQNRQPPRGGRHVEFGYAMARGKAIHVIGDRENIFHYLPGINIYPNFDAFLKGIQE